MTLMELGALGEFLGVFALVATLIYLSIQVRHARNESEKAVLEARATGLRELHMGIATSDGLSAALIKAKDAVDETPSPFETDLISHGLDRQEANRVSGWYYSQWRLDLNQYDTATQEQRIAQGSRLRGVYSHGLARLFWDTTPFANRGGLPFSVHVNQLIAEADQQQETQQ